MLTLVGLIVGFAGLFGLLACLIGLIVSLIGGHGKIGWVIGLILCVILLIGGTFVVADQRPNINIPVVSAILHKGDDSSDSSGGIDTDKGLFNVTITVPADFIEEGTTQEQLDQEVKDSKLKSATLNDDGSVTYVMSKAQHTEMMDGIREEIDNSLAEMAGSESYPSFVSVEANSDYTKYTVTVSTEELGISESFSVLGFYLFSGMYHAFNGTEIDNVCVQFVSEDTGEVIEEANSADME